MAKKVTAEVSAKELEIVTEVLRKLSIQAKFSHMRVPVQAIMGGVLLPKLVELGQVDGDDPQVQRLLDSYSKKNVKELLNPDPITVEIDKIIEQVVYERPIYRRLKSGVNKQILKERTLDTMSRDVIIRWWNVNQRLVAKDDPVTVTLTAQINALYSDDIPLAPMQLPGYFSHLCRMGLKTEDDRDRIFSASMDRGDHTVMPLYTKKILDEILENWEFQRKLEENMNEDHAELAGLREKGLRVPLIARVL
jgi:hypothetical protein